MEYVHYGLLSLFTLAAVIFIINSHYRWTYFFAIAQFILFASFMFSITGQWQRAINFASVLFVVLMLFHRLKIHFYKQPLLINDFFVAFDWRNWETLLHYPLAIFAVMALLGVLGYGILGWSDVASLGIFYQLGGAVIALLSLGLIMHYNKNKSAIRQWLDSLPDDGRDVFLNLPMSFRGVFFKPPEFEGNSQYFEQQVNSVTDYPISDSKPDIVIWLQESTFNPQNFKLESHEIPPISMYEKSETTKFLSPLRVHTLGGQTWKSEFAFLSGLPSTDFGTQATGVFYSVVPHLKYSFIKNLKAQGYYCVALSPFTKGNYNAKPAYDNLGFDLMLQPQDLGYPAPMGKNLWTIGSDEMSHYVQKILNKEDVPEPLKSTDKPLFVYVLTMREHGPYYADCGNVYNLQQSGFTEKGCGELNDYIQRIVKLNDVMEDFEQVMAKRSKPYVLGYFGDHQTLVSGAKVGYQFNYKKPEYITQFAVRTNLNTDFVQQQDFLDLALAAGVIMEIAGLPSDEFMQANIAMRKLSNGKLEDCENVELLAGYRNYLYSKLQVAND